MTGPSSDNIHIAGHAKNMILEQERGKRWQWKHLREKLTIDAASAVTAAGLIAPLVIAIDKYVPCWNPSIMIESTLKTLSLIPLLEQSSRGFQARRHSWVRQRNLLRVSFSAHTPPFSPAPQQS